MDEGKHEACSNQVKHNESVKILGPEEQGDGKATQAQKDRELYITGYLETSNDIPWKKKAKSRQPAGRQSENELSSHHSSTSLQFSTSALH